MKKFLIGSRQFRASYSGDIGTVKCVNKKTGEWVFVMNFRLHHNPYHKESLACMKKAIAADEGDESATKTMDLLAPCIKTRLVELLVPEELLGKVPQKGFSELSDKLFEVLVMKNGAKIGGAGTD